MTKLFLSSPECGRRKDGFDQMIEMGNKFYLYSYFNIKGKKDLLDYLQVDGEVFLDSGAHTLQKNSNKKVDYDKFVDEYIAFINKYSEYIDYFVELDIENKVGLKKVEEFRDRIIKGTKREPIVVWHKERGWKYYVEMCKKYKWVGFSGFVVDSTGGKEVPDKFVPLFVETAHKYGAKIHGFGYTNKHIYKLGFDTVDSSSWGAGKRFGAIQRFNTNRMVSLRHLKNYGDKYGEMTNFAVSEWIKYQNYLLSI